MLLRKSHKTGQSKCLNLPCAAGTNSCKISLNGAFNCNITPVFPNSCAKRLNRILTRPPRQQSSKFSITTCKETKYPSIIIPAAHHIYMYNSMSSLQTVLTKCNVKSRISKKIQHRTVKSSESTQKWDEQFVRSERFKWKT